MQNLAELVSVHFCEPGFAGAAMLAETCALLMSGLTLHQERRASFASFQRIAFTLYLHGRKRMCCLSQRVHVPADG